jgi:hypothetical protein
MSFSRQALTCVLVGSISALAATGCGSDAATPAKDAGATGNLDVGSPATPDTGSTPAPDTGSTPAPDTGSTPAPDTGSTPAPDTGAAATADFPLTAAAGGAVVLGQLKADVPAGALAADTVITVKTVDVATLPTPSSVISAVYDLGPDGTTFLKPVKLTFDLDATKLAAGEVASIAFVKAGAWEVLADSMTKDGKVTATTTHFTDFGLVKSKAASTPTPGCPTGVYTLISFKCNAADITSVWKSIIPSTTLTFSSQGTACKMLITNTSPVCKEVQEETFVFGAQGSHVGAGITSC